MISENADANATIVDAIIYVHRNGVLPPGGAPAGVAFNNGTRALVIDYGYNGTRRGSIEITHGQFQVARVTDAGGNLRALARYNHEGTHTTKQSFIDALRCTDLNASQTHASALIILTSECCRSSMVSAAISNLLTGDANFSDNAWGGLQFAFTTYGHTAAFKGYDINAGGKPWTWLRADDYLGYIGSPGYNGNRVDNERNVKAARDFRGN